MDINCKSNMQSKSQICFRDDLEDSFIEIFRSCQNSDTVPRNVSSGNGERERKELSISLPQKNESVSIVDAAPKDELGYISGNESASKLSEICNLLKDKIIQHCPICLKKNTCDQISGFIAHLKGCASKHKLSTEQLIKAVQLVEKQTSERVAIGLPKSAFEKTTVKRNYKKKVGMDSNMQLAMALSASLRESEFLTRLKETETLIEAGLEQEVVLSCKQLEDFGFKTSKQSDIRPPKISSRSKNRNTILFSRSQAERERIITEKVAIILIDSDGQNSDSIFPANSCYFEPKSRFLRSIRDKNFEIWKKSFQSNEEASDQRYYLENLSSFISPCKVEAGAKLKHVSQIPGRMSSGESHFSRCLQELIDFFQPTTNQDAPKPTKIISSHPVVQKPKISRLSSDYKSLVNKKFMSDITIYAKHERSIYAHKVVFYARCGSILNDSIKETENGKTREIIMWMEFSYESVIAFLEYVYADASDSVYLLDEQQLSDLSELCSRYHVNDLKSCIDELTLKKPFASNAVPLEENFFSRSSRRSACESSNVDEKNVSTRSPSPINGEKNLEFLQMALATQNEPSSPEMFVESDTPFVEENDFSLSIRDSSPSASCSHSDTPVNSVDSVGMKKCNTSLAESSQKWSLRTVGVEKAQTPQWTCDTDVICLSDDDDVGIAPDVDPIIPQDVHQMKLNEGKSEKRKSASPLLMSPAKKRILPKVSPQKSQLKRKVRKKLGMQKTSSQYTLSDSFESSDSDESLYKITANICESSPIPSCSTNLSQRSSKLLSKNEQSQKNNESIAADSSFDLDDFRSLEPESRNRPDIGDHSDSEVLVGGVNSGAKVDAPYISPIWDGFDNYDDNYFDMNFSYSPVAPVSKFSTPEKNLLTKSLVSPISSRTLRRKSCKEDESPNTKNFGSSGTPSVPTFESFSLDESVLNKLESNANVPKPGTLTQVATPSNVRKLKARSKSDTFLTPSPRRNGHTPMADYSGMKTVELKKELDKYGLKPGLSKGKAKQLLRHIYDQLHPIEEETTPKRQPEEKQKPKKKIRKNYARSNSPNENLVGVPADTDESSDSFASGIEELEASFTDDLPTQDNITESKSQKVSIDVGFRNLLREDKELHAQILIYEPIWLEQVKIKLKEKNIKCSSSSLMNYLDEKCITFRTRNQRRVRAKRKKVQSAAEIQAT